MTNEELDALEQLANAATSPPWVPSDDNPSDVVVWCDEDKGGRTKGWIANMGADITLVDRGDDPGCIEEAANAAFVCAARSMVPKLIAHCRRLEAENARLREKAEDMKRKARSAVHITRFRFSDGLRAELLDGEDWIDINVEEAVRICERARYWFASQDIAEGAAMVDVVEIGGNVVDPTFRGALARTLSGAIKLHERAAQLGGEEPSE